MTVRATGLTFTRSQPLPPIQETGIYHLPNSVPDERTLKTRVHSSDPEAQYIQAVYHYKGIHAPLDWHLANALMKKSADQGYPPAQCAYAHFAQTGVGMKMDYGVAQHYYLKASENGIQAATNALIAIQNDTVWLERYGRKRRLTSAVEYQHPRRQPDVTFGGAFYVKKYSGQYSPLNLPKRLQKTNPLGL
jgi:TPR repeat protein